MTTREFDDPYEPPHQRTRAVRRKRRESNEFPTFCKTIFIIELVFMGFRTLFVLLAIVGYAAMKQQPVDPQLLKSVPFEIGTGLGMVISGFLSNIFLLLRQRWATLVGWIYTFISGCSLIVALWQFTIYASQFAPGSPERAGAYVGGGFMMVLRLALLVLYVVALLKFTQWMSALESLMQEASADFETDFEAE